MQRVSRSTAVATLPSPPSGGTPGFFAKPDPVGGVPATVPGYEWFNWLQEEMAALAAMNGAALDGAQFTQARDAVNALLAAKPSQGQLQGQTYTAFTTTGVSGTFVMTPTPAIGAYAANQRFRVKFNAAGNGSDTINVSGKGAVALKQYDSTGAKVAPVISAGQLADIEYDGTNFVILDPLPANSLTQAAADARYSRLGLAAVAYSTNTTLTLSNIGQIIYFTGTAATFTLPLSNAAAGGQMQMIISNQGSGILTLAMQGGNTTDLSFLSLSPTQSLAVVNDGGTVWHHLWSEVGTTGSYSVGNATANTHAVNKSQVLGLGQTWQNVTASRALGTTYYNTTGKAIHVAVTNYSSSYIAGAVIISIDGVAIVSTGAMSGAAGAGYGGAMVTVPAGSNYSATCPTYGSLNNWMEFK